MRFRFESMPRIALSVALTVLACAACGTVKYEAKENLPALPPECTKAANTPSSGTCISVSAPTPSGPFGISQLSVTASSTTTTFSGQCPPATRTIVIQVSNQTGGGDQQTLVEKVTNQTFVIEADLRATSRSRTLVAQALCYTRAFSKDETRSKAVSDESPIATSVLQRVPPRR